MNKTDIPYLLHFSDTIAKWDSTVDRLILQYKLLFKHFWNNIDLKFVASEYSNSYQTSMQVLKFLKKYNEYYDKPISQTILINNAARSKFKNSWNAKWSDCYWVKLKLPNSYTIHDVVWVDHICMAQMIDYIVEIKIVRGFNFNWVIREDISRWSQFRSLEYFPIVQMLVLNNHIEKLILEDITIEELRQFKYDNFDINKIDKIDCNAEFNFIENDLIINQDYIKIYKNDALWKSQTFYQVLWQAYKYKLDNNCEISDILLIDNKKYENLFIAYIDNWKWIRSQLISWNLKDFILLKEFVTDFWVLDNSFSLWSLIQKDFWNNITILMWKLSLEHRKVDVSLIPDLDLENDQIVIIDKDKFWNTKALTKYYDWIHWLGAELGLEVWNKVKIKSDKMFFRDHAYLTESISDKTWEKCIWNWSSRWISWNILIELNRSFDESWVKWIELDNLNLWDYLRVE